MALYKVRYKGLSDVREVAANDPGLKARGIKFDKKLVWERANNWTVVIEGMSEEVETWLREEGTFTVTEVDEQSGEEKKNVVTASKADDTGSTVVDGTTGQVSTAPTGRTGRGRST